MTHYSVVVPGPKLAIRSTESSVMMSAVKQLLCGTVFDPHLQQHIYICTFFMYTYEYICIINMICMFVDISICIYTHSIYIY